MRKTGEMISKEVLARLRDDAKFTRDRIGAPGCQKREDACDLLAILDWYEADSDHAKRARRYPTPIATDDEK